MKPVRIMLSAGEVSGDIHGAKLIEILKKKYNFEVVSVGGAKMEVVSDFMAANIVSRAAVGFAEALKLIPFFAVLKKRLKKQYFSHESSNRIDALVLIDFPGFNIRLGKEAAACGVQVFYYITPQVWAWGSKRIPLLSEMCRRLFCVFSFEKQIFLNAGGAAEFVGHPIMEDIPDVYDTAALDLQLGIGSSDRVLALLPGSRKQEVLRHLPIMMEAAGRTGLLPVIARPESISEDFYRGIIGTDIKVTDDFYTLLKRAEAAVVKSGTSTIQAAIAGVPFVTVYRVSPVTYFLAKRIIDIPYICMVNILAGKELIPELIQKNFNPGRLSEAVLKVIEDREIIKNALKDVVSKLGGPGASEKTAGFIASDIMKKKQ